MIPSHADLFIYLVNNRSLDSLIIKISELVRNLRLRTHLLDHLPMSRMINLGASGARASSSADSSPPSPLLSQSGSHGIPLGRANLSQIAQSIDVAAVKALE